MVLQKVAEEGHVELTDTLIDDNNVSIKVRFSVGVASVWFILHFYSFFNKCILVLGFLPVLLNCSISSVNDYLTYNCGE